jgi:hypothetical protein
VQWTKVNVFDRDLLVLAIGAVLAAATLGLAHAYPVGGPITGALKPVTLDKGFQQINRMAIFALPVVA